MNTEKLIIENKWLVDTIALRYEKTLSNFGYDLDDLRQEGYIAIWQASKTYNKDKKMSFVNYSSLYIKGRIRNLLVKKNVYMTELKDIYPYDQGFDVLDMLLDVNLALEKIDNEIAKAYFCLKLEGLNDYEIARLCNRAQPVVYRSIQKTIKRIQRILRLKECI